jgi:hypothetical protein
MRHYRALFEELVESDADAALSREHASGVPASRTTRAGR